DRVHPRWRELDAAAAQLARRPDLAHLGVLPGERERGGFCRARQRHAKTTIARRRGGRLRAAYSVVVVAGLVVVMSIVAATLEARRHVDVARAPVAGDVRIWAQRPGAARPRRSRRRGGKDAVGRFAVLDS